MDRFRFLACRPWQLGMVAALTVMGYASTAAAPPQGSADRQAQREQWCKDNPEKCRELQEKARARREECKADPQKCRAEMQAREEARFRAADADKDGKLTREEAQKGMPGVARNFDRIDVNKDGFVTPQEIEAARKAWAAQRMEKGK